MQFTYGEDTPSSFHDEGEALKLTLLRQNGVILAPFWDVRRQRAPCRTDVQIVRFTGEMTLLELITGPTLSFLVKCSTVKPR